MTGSIFSHLRIVPTGHTQPLPPRPTPPTSENIYDALIHNPYLPFYHIWKPATPWSKAKWEKGTEEVLARQKPHYYAAIIEYVSFSLPISFFSKPPPLLQSSLPILYPRPCTFHALSPSAHKYLTLDHLADLQRENSPNANYPPTFPNLRNPPRRTNRPNKKGRTPIRPSQPSTTQ